VEFDSWSHKWALEVPREGGYLTFTSPGGAEVYVDHMKLYLERDEYPTTRAVLLGGSNKSVKLDPRFDFDMPGAAHVSSMAFIGYVNDPGLINITFLPVETGMVNPFRVTGVIATPRAKTIDESVWP
jgi:hypothetical protein